MHPISTGEDPPSIGELNDSVIRLELTGTSNWLKEPLPGTHCPAAIDGLSQLAALQLRDCDSMWSLETVKSLVAEWIFKLGESLCTFDQLADDGVWELLAMAVRPSELELLWSLDGQKRPVYSRVLPPMDADRLIVAVSLQIDPGG